MARNPARKGTNVELIAIKALEAAGYHVHRTVKTGRRYGGNWISHANDVFGCIDLIAKKAGQRTRWIQVTATRKIGEKKRAMATVPWTPLHDAVEIWRWIDGSGKHTDGRNGAPRPRMYFQVYCLDDGFRLNKWNRIHAVKN